MLQGTQISKWTHIALVHDTDENDGVDEGTFYWYFNGIQQNKLKADGVTVALLQMVLLLITTGFFQWKKRPDKGEIDELRIWNSKCFCSNSK